MFDAVAVPAVFPALGETESRPSRVVAGALSPFASIASPVPAPTAGRPAAGPDVFPIVESLQIRSKVEEPDRGPDLAELERLRAEAAETGYQEGYAEGIERGLREGQERGYEQGRREAYETEMAQRQLALDAFGNALQAKVDGLNGELGGWMREREEAMADLAMEVVRRLLSHELSTSRASVLAIAQEALGEITHATQARIRLNPFDVPILSQHRNELLAASTSLRNIDLVEDSTLLGGCVVETEGGIVDASLDSRLVMLEEAWRPAA